MRAVICPVCNGVGMVSAGFYSHDGNYPYWVSSEVNPETCRSCDGKGWVEVHEESCHSYPMALLTLYPEYLDGTVTETPTSITLT